MLAYNVVLKLRGYISDIKLDFKSTIRQLLKVSTVRNTINKAIVFETIPNINDELKELFTHMKFKLPNRI